MVKLKILFVAAIIVSFLPQTQAQKNRTLSNGFSISWAFGIPSDKLGFPASVDNDFKYKLMMGLKLGNRWYINPTEKYGIGIMVNWLDVSATQVTINQGNIDEPHATADVSVLQIGPIFTYALDESIAFDLYYNLRPTSLAIEIE